ncbi:MAG: hypothetical protein HXY42_06580 [Chloroflexi bacterium]|mgnify:CR=1 FL=1|nr:hypothetical protein [Chloroflexota bacterium]
MRRSTSVYVLVFILLTGVYLYLNSRPETPDTDTAEPTTEPIEYLFQAEDGLPTGIRIESKAGEVVEVARNTENAWELILPETAAADQGSVEAAAIQVTTIRILDRIPGLAPEAVGLETPEYTMSFKFTGGTQRNIEIGVLTPTQSGYYTRGEGLEVLIVSKSAVDALLQLLANPPYAVTETPPPATP